MLMQSSPSAKGAIWSFLVLTMLPGTLGGCTLSKSQCYVDDSKRILNSDRYGGALSREYCAQFCSDNNYTVAGVENGQECY